MGERGVDPRSLELARHFLTDMGAQDTLLADLLAERIQAAVEDWFDELKEPHLVVMAGGLLAGRTEVSE